MENSVKILFDKQALIDKLEAYDTNQEYKCWIRSQDFIKSEEQKRIIDEAIFDIHNLYDDKILSYTKLLKTKKNGGFRKGAVYSIFDIDIADYVTDFTSCWFHDRIALRAIDESTVTIVLENTQTTH